MKKKNENGLTRENGARIQSPNRIAGFRNLEMKLNLEADKYTASSPLGKIDILLLLRFLDFSGISFLSSYSFGTCN